MAQKIPIAVIMGSSSDGSVMQAASELLNKFGIEHDVKVISAHRSPAKLAHYLKELPSLGVDVIIAGAGKAAHLPGVIASQTSLPVIGVPIQTSDLGGLDSLLSIVQMPPGIPVATVAINGAKNAAILAIQILALNDKALENKLVELKAELAEGGTL